MAEAIIVKRITIKNMDEYDVVEAWPDENDRMEIKQGGDLVWLDKEGALQLALFLSEWAKS